MIGRAALVAATILLAGQAVAETVPVPARRPERAAPAPAAPAPPVPAAPAADAPFIHRAACPALLEERVKGRMSEPILEGDCRVDSPLAITAIGGIPLAREAVVTCAMAEALSALAGDATRIALETTGSAIASIDAGGGQECRLRNRQSEGKLSEHALANALDVMSVTLADGRVVGVEAEWPGKSDEGDGSGSAAERAATPQARFLTALHAAACLRFTTVLGPDADEHHRDHLHFDLGCHGKACDFRICQ